MGGLMLLLFALRFFVFEMYESPKYLMGRGRDAEAVAVVHKVAWYNGRASSLTLEMLQDAGRAAGEGKAAGEGGVGGGGGGGGGAAMDTSARGALSRKLRAFSGEHVKSLFATRKLAYSTTLLIILWGRSFPC